MSLLTALIGWVLLLSELGLTWRRRSSRVAESRTMDDGSLSLLWRVIGGAIAAGYVLAAFGVGPRLPAGVPWGWIGLGVFAVGAVVRWWAIHHLGRFFTVDVAVAQDHRVVDTGPYRLVRHPSYTGLLLQLTGLALSLNHGLSLLVILLPVTTAIIYRIRVEERALLTRLGGAYASYICATKRLVPLVY